ncbi:MAG: RecQ family ATP-dependent DNA helicase [Mucilaginibacter polytrichastri]|nr:RecQ family ATP-dependent DNA helicase [Mucilaginibacter polytrichastri]
MSVPDIHALLKKYWGYDQFRPLQEEIIRAVLDGRDTLALMPTGGGKSICFQVPALAMDGICLVISPLIALMKDQVENLQRVEIPAAYVVSGMKKKEVELVLEGCIAGQYKFLYLSPERLLSAQFQAYVQHMQVSLIAVDEAHCISQWGYDFRPPYLHIAELRQRFSKTVPVLALTATATEHVKTDIQEKLGFRRSNVFQRSYERKNLSYVVRYAENKLEKMLDVIRNVGGTGIVYVRSRRECMELSQYLGSENVRSGYYHAGMSADERSAKQRDWKENKIQVIVATNAFGMGIDKADVRFVIHKDLPESLEAYYQEAGRAGRDEKKAFAALLFSSADKHLLIRKHESSFPGVDEVKDVYNRLAEYFRIAYGAGQGFTADFDIGDFCRRNQLQPVRTLQALRFLERDEYLALTEPVFLPARFSMIVSHEDLYQYQVSHASLDPFIKTLLRSYGGAFHHFVQIREAEIARRSGLAYTEVIDTLQLLDREGIISYQPKNDRPQITFLAPRLEKRTLMLNRAYMEERKAVSREKLDAMIAYAESPVCRSRQLLAYFGETGAPKCGVCDVCIDEKRAARAAGIQDQISSEILQILSLKPLSLKELVRQISGQENEKLTVIREMLDTARLKTDGEHYYV